LLCARLADSSCLCLLLFFSLSLCSRSSVEFIAITGSGITVKNVGVVGISVCGGCVSVCVNVCMCTCLSECVCVCV
jgi:hypothetical protein